MNQDWPNYQHFSGTAVGQWQASCKGYQARSEGFLSLAGRFAFQSDMLLGLLGMCVVTPFSGPVVVDPYPDRPLGRAQRVVEQHGDGHRADAARHRADQ